MNSQPPIKKLAIRSPKLNYQFKMFRVQNTNIDADETREQVMDIMNNYLEQNDGKLINVKILKNSDICVYYITGQESIDQNWEYTLQNQVLRDFKIIPSVIELGPSTASIKQQI